MSDQDPFEPPASDVGNEQGPHAGSVGWGIFLAMLTMIGVLLAAPYLRGYGCVGVPFFLPLLLGGVPFAALITDGAGKTKTAKGLWIGYVLVLGLLVLLVGLIWAACSGMRL